MVGPGVNLSGGDFQNKLVTISEVKVQNWQYSEGNTLKKILLFNMQKIRT